MVGAILGAGIILSFYGAQLTTQNIIVKEETIAPDSSVEVTTELDPQVGETGVFAVLVDNFEQDTISISLYDSFGTEIISAIAEKESTEERFEIISDGTYKLLIQNSGQEVKIFAGLGYMPDSGALSVGITGFYLLIVGLIGIVGVGLFAIRSRQKNKLS